MCTWINVTCNVTLNKLVSCCSTDKNFESLQKDLELLKAAKDGVKVKLEVAVRQHLTMLNSVGVWLKQVETVETKFGKLEKDYEQQSADKCFWGYCPRNIKTNYTFRENLDDVREEVVSLLRSKPEDLAIKILPTQPTERPVEPTFGIQFLLDKAWRHFEDVKVGTIGLHGMGGVGKTTLLKELHNKLCRSAQKVDFVLWIVVSQNPNLPIIQNDIGKKLGYQNDAWKEKSQDEKRQDIYNALNGKKYVLFLDDVWNRFDLQELGFPLPNEANESKVLLTTRSIKVCYDMEANSKKIQVTCLNDEAAWNLFREKVGESTINANPNIPEIAKLLAKKCDGLPLALVVIGRAMASKNTPQSWSHALNLLEKKATDFAGMGDQILPLLKFSYDDIEEPAIKSCFLYCSLYPEDNLIVKTDIIDKWICEGFLNTFDDLHEARNEGYDHIDTLVSASLLEESSSEEFKMHDVIREMAIWIAMQNKFFVRAGVGLRETPNMAGFEGLERMSLMDNQIDKLIGDPNCPNLLTLFLNRATELNWIDNEYFGSMENLRVLDLSNNRKLKEIPEEVCELVSLKYLSLASMGIEKFPTNLSNLINLKWLSIGSNKNGVQIPEGVLRSFKALEVLDLSNNFGVVLPETFEEEVKSLTHLKDLRITIFSGDVLSRFSSSHKAVSITTLLMVALYGIEVDISICNNLISRGIYAASNLHYNYTGLKSLYIYSCSLLENIAALVFAPNLEHIDVSNCERVTELCGDWQWDDEEHAGGRPSPTPFPKLTSLICVHLGEMERIYPTNLLFPYLKQMHITACTKLKKLPFNSSSCDSGSGVTIVGEEEWWNELEWQDDDTRIAFGPSFEKWEVRKKNPHRNIFL